MKATLEIPDDLYRQVKAKSALEGRPVRAVAEALFRRYVEEGGAGYPQPKGKPAFVGEEAAPAWFGMLRPYARRVKQHDLDAIRESIARGIGGQREPSSSASTLRC